ncbi:hypothetical protein ACTNE5_00435 [Acidaminococcus fermentans]|uniref:hypothetical protein n=1 Tax=Acidaminococcus fermentans TaxID=905 RepID=UPI003F8AB4CF
MSEFTDGTMTGNTLSMVEMEKRLEALTTRLDALSKVKKIPVETPNNYVECKAYQVGNVVSVDIKALYIPTENEELVTGLPKPTTLIIQNYVPHGYDVNKNIQVLLRTNGELFNWYSTFSGELQQEYDLQFHFCYITEEV